MGLLQDSLCCLEDLRVRGETLRASVVEEPLAGLDAVVCVLEPLGQRRPDRESPSVGDDLQRGDVARERKRTRSAHGVVESQALEEKPDDLSDKDVGRRGRPRGGVLL